MWTLSRYWCREFRSMGYINYRWSLIVVNMCWWERNPLRNYIWHCRLNHLHHWEVDALVNKTLLVSTCKAHMMCVNHVILVNYLLFLRNLKQRFMRIYYLLLLLMFGERRRVCPCKFSDNILTSSTPKPISIGCSHYGSNQKCPRHSWNSKRWIFVRILDVGVSI